jgi:hypothetical protein
MDIVMKDSGSGKEQAQDQFHGLYVKTQEEESEVRYQPVTLLSIDEMVKMDPSIIEAHTANMLGIIVPKERENLE